MYDILYCTELPYEEVTNIENKIKAEYPDVKLETDSDDIHGTRISFELDSEIGMEEYYKFLIKNKLANLSFHFGMSVRENPEKVKKIVKEIISN